MESEMIYARNLGMVRGVRKLFSGIDFDVGAGDLVVLRGPNGSGKTTLLRILAGLTSPIVGEVSVHSPHHWIGHLNGLKPFETAKSHLKLWASTWGGDGIDRAAKTFQLEKLYAIPVGLLSAGQKRRLALARLLLVNREIWLLDEPLASLDQTTRHLVRRLITDHCKKGGCVVTAMHEKTDMVPSFEISL